MKTIITMALFALVCLSAKAQKLEKPIIDKFSGDTTLLTTEATLTNKFSLIVDFLACSSSKISNYYFIDFHVIKGAVGYFAIHKGDKCYLKFDDGSILTLFAPSDADSKIRYSSSTSSSEAYVSFGLKDDDIQKIRSAKLTNIRIVTSVAPFDYDIKDGKSEVVKKEVELLASK